MTIKNRLSFRHLLALGIVNSRASLSHKIKHQDFPPGRLTGLNSRTWEEDEIQGWVDSRPTKPKKTPLPTYRPGRPRKAKPVTATGDATA